MTQKAGAATVGADYNQAQLQAQTDKALYDLGVISGLTYNASKGKADELTTRDDREAAADREREGDRDAACGAADQGGPGAGAAGD